MNTNQWLPSIAPDNNYYSYFQPIGSANRGVAFDNARALLTWRYGNNYNSQPLLSAAFTNFANPLANETFDIYPTGPLVTNLATTFYLNPNSIPWAGFPSFNRFFALPSELFDSAKSSTGLGSFTNHLHLAGETVANDGARPTYDRYTYYRMLDQLGTDTAPADDRMNLNYDNLDYAGNIVPGAETNLIAWTPLRFFTNAADRLLRTYTTNWFHKNPSNFLATYYRITGASANFYHQDGFGNVITNDPTGFGLTNIPYFGMTNELPAFGIGNVPVLVSNTLVYSPSINRLLQLAANIYDASTNEFYPHVFRPQFYRNPTSGDVFIVGYQEVVSVDKTAQGGIGDVQMARPIQVEQLNSGYSTANYPVGINVYGVPWIIGAKKYLPNFNTFYSYNTLQVSRKLQFTRTAVEAWNPGTTSIHFRTNQMFLMSITNHLGFSFWNSYVSNYPGIAPVVFAGDDIRMRLSYGAYSYSSSNYFSWFTNPAVWEGSYWDLTKAPGGRGDPNQFSFLSRRFDFPFVREAALSLDQSGTPVGSGFTTPVFNPAITSLPTFPDFKIESTNLFQGFIIDDGHVIDYVQLSGPISSHQAEADLKDLDYNSGVSKYLFWATNANAGGLNYGVVSQIEASKKGDLTDNIWKAPANIPSGLSGRENEAQFFAAFFTASNIVKNGRTFSNTNLQQQAPFTPVRTVTTPTIWTANDPLVHYLSSDLNAPLTGLANAVWPNDNPYSSTLPTPDLGGIPGGTPIPQRYQPWGTGGQMDEIAGDTRFTFNLGLKDSLVTGSDDWNFPTSRYPSAGWLGRVHRGTPWQTVYLKATNIWEYIDAGKVLAPNLGQQAWLAWLGDDDEYDGKNSRPIQDALLFDIFTAALHPNATLGALSVNQTHLAAWSALLSGMMAMTNTTDVPSFDFRPVLTNLVIEPAGINNVDSPLWKIVWGADGINNTRTNKNIFADGAFTRIGDILRVPALTEQSPFINRNNVDASGTGLPFGDQRLQMDISDAQYEWLPQQMLGLLRCTTAPRYVIYSYGQTLKPAIGGTVLDSAFFGLVTNYQVVAESATRTVLSVQPVITTKVINGVVVPTTNYTTRVESFNPLPPE